MSNYSIEDMQLALKMLEQAQGQKQGGIGFKHDLSPAAGVAPYIHGQGGLFSTPGADVRVFSAVNMPMSLLTALPVMPAGTSVTPGEGYGGFDTPFFDTVTGVTAGSLDSWANQPDAPCDDPPYAGLMKLCTLTAPYGRFYGRIRPVDITRAARLTNRGEPTDLQLMNNPANQVGFVGSSLFPGGINGDVTISELNARLTEGAVGFARQLMPLVYTGSPGNNKAGGGARQFLGLDYLVAAGNKRDAFSSVICYALDSDVKDFNNNLVNDSDSNPSIVQYIDMIYYYVNWNAEQQGLAPATFALVMRPELFDEIVKVWSVRYYEEALLAIAAYGNGRVNVSAVDATEARDDMRRQKFLPIRGDRVPVILDNTIPEDNSTTAAIPAGSFSSDIYLIPLTVLGSIPVTYLEAFNYDASRVQELLSFAGIEADAYTTSDNGRFLLWRHRTNVCIDIRWLTEFRIIMRTPQLAAKLQNVRYAPLQHTRDWNTDSSYWVNGGRTNTAISGLYTEWGGSSPVVIS